MGGAHGCDGFEAYEAANAMVHVDHEIACRQCSQLGDDILRTPRLALGPHQTIAENVLLADDGEILGLKS